MKSIFLRPVLSRMPVNGPRSARMSVYALLLWILLCPIGAFGQCNETGDIVFTVTKKANLPPNWVMKLSGPWQRLSNKVDLTGLSLNDPCRFYAAIDNAFSPRGQWDIYVWNNSGPAPSQTTARLCVGNPATVDLEVAPGPNGGVKLTLPDWVKVGSIRNGGVLVCRWETRTILDAILIRSSSGEVQGTQPDSDVFQFEGTANDSVTVRVEADPQSGNNGGQATLRLSGGAVNSERTGTLPLEIIARLDVTGTYNITVEQPDENPFRGPYIVSVESRMDAIHAPLIPTDSVEQ